MFDHFLESSHQDDSNKWSNIEFGVEITQVASIEIHFTHRNWGSDLQWMKIQTGGCLMQKHDTIQKAPSRFLRYYIYSVYWQGSR